MLERLKPLLTDEKLNKLNKANILLVGLGGVGGQVYESLIRSGITNMTIIDNDTFESSNLNRQILSTNNNIGEAKTTEALKKGLSINPNINIEIKTIFLDNTNINEIDFTKFNYIIDCCDTTKTKLLLIQNAIKYNIKVISSMGTGNRLDPTKLYITDIWKTENDPLAKAMRKLLRENNIKEKIPVLASKEIPIKTHEFIASSYFVPNTAGIYIANWVFNDIINK